MHKNTQRVRSADGALIAYEVLGSGEQTVVLTNGYTTSHFYWAGLLPTLTKHARVITWDLKGHGESEGARDLSKVRIEDSVDDLRRVLDAAGVERAHFAAFSLGCQIIFEAWRQYPERIKSLVPILGTFGRPFDNLIHPRVGPLAFSLFKRLPRKVTPMVLKAAYLGTRPKLVHKLNQLTGSVGADVPHASMAPMYDHFSIIDAPTWHAMGVQAQSHSAHDVLASVSVPTLVISGGRDTFTPGHLGATMYAAIPDAERLHLPDATHTGLHEFSDLIAHRMVRFWGMDA